MTPRHAADRLTARIRAWWGERRARREAARDEESGWLPSLPEDRELGPFDPVKQPGHRLGNYPDTGHPDAQPGDNSISGKGPTAINAALTHCRRGHAFDASNIFITSDGGRRCRTCERERQSRRIRDRSKAAS